ncbi:MAG: methyltransferase domain-containing protein [Rickettsiales bacterium]|nr:methyltransferase domain-containing protein [Rickettsiales bacterium]
MPRKKQKPRKATIQKNLKQAVKPTVIQAEPGQKLVLHVGCGRARKQDMHQGFHGDEWKEVRLDISNSVNPDIVGDMRDMPTVASHSMDGLFSSHNLEHVYAHEVPKVLGEFFRVIKPGGLAVITLPDIQSVAFSIAKGGLEEALYESPVGPITPLEMLYGYNKSLEQGEHYMAHKTAFTAQTLAVKMLNAGFHNVTVARQAEGHSLWARGFKPGEKLKNAVHKAELKGNYDKAVIDLPRPGEKKDDLDASPKLWKALGLNKGQQSLF